MVNKWGKKYSTKVNIFMLGRLVTACSSRLFSIIYVHEQFTLISAFHVEQVSHFFRCTLNTLSEIVTWQAVPCIKTGPRMLSLQSSFHASKLMQKIPPTKYTKGTLIVLMLGKNGLHRIILRSPPLSRCVGIHHFAQNHIVFLCSQAYLSKRIFRTCGTIMTPSAVPHQKYNSSSSKCKNMKFVSLKIISSAQFFRMHRSRLKNCKCEKRNAYKWGNKAHDINRQSSNKHINENIKTAKISSVCKGKKILAESETDTLENLHIAIEAAEKSYNQARGEVVKWIKRCDQWSVRNIMCKLLQIYIELHSNAHRKKFEFLLNKKFI